MLVRAPDAFLAAWQRLPETPWGASTPRAVMLMAPEGLTTAAATAADNRYMATGDQVDADLAHRQHRDLAQRLSGPADPDMPADAARRGVPVWTFPGDAGTPDATFLNNAFATVPGRLILGAMRYRQRQHETARADIRAFFADVLGYDIVELQGAGVVAELTGSLVIDRRRGVGLCGLGERCNLAGAQAMHEAFGLRLTYAFELAAGEYHTNVVMSVLAGRTLVLCREGLADPQAARALAQAWQGRCVELGEAEKNAFAGNCIVVREPELLMSQAGVDSLRPATRQALAEQGWQLQPVPLSQIELAGGSLRCCVGEVF